LAEYRFGSLRNLAAGLGGRTPFVTIFAL
jgi:hypothetical protein